ncbi:MAG: hypothetical protein MI757_11010, partial [Pirellulales bacterium]|nr:hypothetical protein [Pirellulales bacterium]
MIRDRIVELRRVKASELAAHPRNWRTHPQHQRDALGGLLGDIGLADAVIARELPNGKLQLIDGHLRAELADEETLPVLVVDLDDDETNELLLSHDAITGLAGVDPMNLMSLLTEVKTSDDALRTVFADFLDQQTQHSTDAVEPKREVD